MKNGLIVLISTAFAFITGCTTAPHAETTHYFPDETENAFLSDLASTLLRIDEPSLYEQRSRMDLEEYRLICIQSFDKPFFVRIWKDATSVRLRVVRLNCQGGYDGHIEYEDTLKIGKDKWDELKSLLGCPSFWEMPAREKNGMGLDGYDWILEGQMPGQYHQVWRWTPESHIANRHLEAYREACLYLISLTKMKLREPTLVDEQPVQSQQSAFPRRKF